VGHTQAPGPKTDELRLRDERNAEMKRSSMLLHTIE
jgi:hypothetical protein